MGVGLKLPSTSETVEGSETTGDEFGEDYGFDPAVRRGLLGFYYMGFSSARSVRNLSGGITATDTGVIVNEDSIQGVQTGTRLLDTNIPEAETATLYLLAKPVDENEAHLISTWFGERANGDGVEVAGGKTIGFATSGTTSDGLVLAKVWGSRWTGNANDATATMSSACATPISKNAIWLLRAEFDPDYGVRIFNMTNGESAEFPLSNFAAGTQMDRTSATWRICGDRHTAKSNSQVFAAALYSVIHSTSEAEQVAAQIRGWMGIRGLSEG